MKRSTFLGALGAVGALQLRAAAGSIVSKEIAGVRVPDTAMAREATSIARAAEPAAIFNHSLRTFLFAELFAAAKGIDHDSEIVYVASILHDTGMAARYMSPRNPFEVDGANVARSLLAKYGVTETRRRLVWDAIALHDNGGIAQHKEPEVSLVNTGVSADFGAYLDSLPRAKVVSILQAAPRAGFYDAFLSAAAAVAKRKPLASAHSFVADVGYCKVPGFHLPSFCDIVKEDPFASYG